MTNSVESVGDGGSADTVARPGGGGPIRVMVVDDHPMWRDAVARDLSESGFDVVATAGDGEQAVRRAHAAAPDVLVLDLNLPAKPGVQVCKELVGANPALRVLVLSASGEHADVLEAVKSGATGYLLKSASTEELIDAVRQVGAGGRYLSPSVTDTVITDYLHEKKAPDALHQLSSRERHVLQMLVEGKTAASVARKLHLSPRTIETYKARLMRKLGLADLPALVKFAVRHGLTPLD